MCDPITIRDILMDNLKANNHPQTIKDLAEKSGVSWPVIKKMWEGDYTAVRHKSIIDAFDALGCDIQVGIIERKGNAAS